MRSSYPRSLRHSTWFALLNAESLKQWKKLPTWDREHIGNVKFTKFKALAEQNRAAILIEEARLRDEHFLRQIEHSAIKAKREIHAMSVQALVNVEQRAYDAVREILDPDPKDHPLSEADDDSVESFMTKCAHGFYSHRDGGNVHTSYQMRMISRMSSQ